MLDVASTTRKRPVNLSLSETLVTQAKAFTNNLSSTVDDLLADFVAQQRQRASARKQLADTCSQDWNTLHESIGSFADEHSTL